MATLLLAAVDQRHRLFTALLVEPIEIVLNVRFSRSPDLDEEDRVERFSHDVDSRFPI